MAKEYLSVTTVAARLGMSPRRVREICQEHGIGSTLGDGKRTTRLLTEADVKRIQKQRRPRGNPNFQRPKP